MFRSAATFLAISVLPVSVSAQQISTAAACAENLSTDAKQIYDLVAPDVNQSSIIKDIMIAKIKPLVMSGKMDRNLALAEAPKAGECLTLLQQD